MRLKITTFNVENMFNRVAMLDTPWENRNYERLVAAMDIASVASRRGDLVSYETTLVQRNNTAQAILDVTPDILVLNEIEDLYTVRNFNSLFLGDYFDRMISFEGNDGRGIDVALCIKAGLAVDVVAVRTHADEPMSDSPNKRVVRRVNPDDPSQPPYIVTGAIFSRDCLEVDVRVGGDGGKVLTFLVNHLKSQDNTAASKTLRAAQAKRVAELATKAREGKKLPIVIGDLNTDPTRTPTDTSLEALLKHAALVDPWKNVAQDERWSHFYAYEKSVSRLDYILVDKDLTTSAPEFFRKGLSTLAREFYAGERYPTIGPANTEASDHCPTSVTIDV